MDPLGICTAPVAGINIGVHLDPVGWKGLIVPQKATSISLFPDTVLSGNQFLFSGQH